MINLPHRYSGKVRDIYEVDKGLLLLVTSDRISAFDVVMTEPVPDKGRVLTAMTAFWTEHLSSVAPSHLVSTELDDLPPQARLPELAGRVMLCHELEMLPIECIVRGYLSGSAWKEYQAKGTVHNMKAPEGMVESDRFDEPIFTPATKADEGHDINISFDEATHILGPDLAMRVREISLELYKRGAARAAERGIIVADTKFEIGLLDGELVVGDEVLTPDSSRFWPADSWKPGTVPPSFDKQPLRDYLDALDWDKTPPPPALPDEVVAKSRTRYVEAYERITGRVFNDWPGVQPSGSNVET